MCIVISMHKEKVIVKNIFLFLLLNIKILASNFIFSFSSIEKKKCVKEYCGILKME